MHLLRFQLDGTCGTRHLERSQRRLHSAIVILRFRPTALRVKGLSFQAHCAHSIGARERRSPASQEHNTAEETRTHGAIKGVRTSCPCSLMISAAAGPI